MVLLEHYYFLLIFQTQYLIGFANLFTDLRDSEHGTQGQGQEIVLCRKCGTDVLDSHYIFSKLSPGAKSKKQNLFGKQNVTIQSLVNPFGVKFDIITAEKARCDNVGNKQKADSWFPGYTWRLCACPHCGQHLGWTFENIEKSNDPKDNVQTFHGLILANVLGENFTDSLMMMPVYTM